MKAGHCFTIEPMINVGVWGDQTWPDNWTSVTQVSQHLSPSPSQSRNILFTQDGSLSAQFEQTMVVTDTGVDVLSARPGKRHVPYFMDS